MRSVERIRIAPFRWLGIRLGYGACIDDLDLERRFRGVLVRGEIGIIGLEAYVVVSILLGLDVLNSSGDLHC